MPFTDLDQEVRAKLFHLMTGLLSLRDFQVWLAPVAWRLGHPENAGRHPLARRVELRVAEYTNGNWTKDQLLAELGALLRRQNVPPTVAVGWGNKSSHPVRPAGWYQDKTTTSSSERR